MTYLVFMRYSDRSFKTRKWLWGIGAVMQVVAYSLFLFMPLPYGDNHQYSDVFLRCGTGRRSLLQGIQPGAFPHDAQRHGTGYNLWHQPDDTRGLELLCPGVGKDRNRAGSRFIDDIPVNQRCCRLLLYAGYLREIFGTDCQGKSVIAGLIR